MRYELKGGAVAEDSRLDRVEEKDERSRAYPVSAALQPEHYARPRSYTWRNALVLDQGEQGACVGFAWAHELAARPTEVHGVTGEFAREQIYYPAQRQDSYPGGEYPGAVPYARGTSLLAAAKVVSALGYIDEYRWAFSFEDLVASVGYRGPALFGCRWYRSMNKPEPSGLLRLEGPVIGFHCVLICGVRIRRDGSGAVSNHASSFLIQNSWGTRWGRRGFGRLSFADTQRLWDGAETCIPIGRHASSFISHD